jgi:hypothetical protein
MRPIIVFPTESRENTQALMQPLSPFRMVSEHLLNLLQTTSQDERHMMQFLHTLQVESMLIQSLQVPVSAWKSLPALLVRDIIISHFPH